MVCIFPFARYRDDDDYPSFFVCVTKQVTNGEVTFTLGENPVFVEENSEELPSPSPSPSGYPDFVKNEATFRLHRDVLIRFVDMLYAEGIKYNYQSGWNFLLAATMYDKRSPSTNSKIFLRFVLIFTKGAS